LISLVATAACTCLTSTLQLVAVQLRTRHGMESRLASALLAAADTHGTPLYVYDGSVLDANCALLQRSLAEAFAAAEAKAAPVAAMDAATTPLTAASALRRPPFQLLYAMKANSNPALVARIAGHGFGIECVSLGEVLLARACGARRILFTSNNVAPAEMEAVLALAAQAAAAGAEASKGDRRGMAGGVAAVPIWVNVDSADTLSRLPPGTEVFMRVNGRVGGGHHDHVITCGPTSKFGVPWEHVPAALAAAAARGVAIVGLHQHIGSGVLDPAKFALAMEVLLDVVRANATALLPTLRYLDFGGGLGVPYRPDDPPLNVRLLATTLATRFVAFCAEVGADVGEATSMGGGDEASCSSGSDSTGGAASTRQRRPALTLVLEPGRYPVAAAGYLLARVNTLKPTPYGRTYAGECVCSASSAGMCWAEYVCNATLTPHASAPYPRCRGRHGV
jgi:diaminopimelate decarboxylase